MGFREKQRCPKNAKAQSTQAGMLRNTNVIYVGIKLGDSQAFLVLTDVFLLPVPGHQEEHAKVVKFVTLRSNGSLLAGEADQRGFDQISLLQ